uniref:Uncharacterized protein n=1 Tax=Candidatus Kentrum sp. LPFa TaxID=2126335 RepID=A0A450Y0E9_9GAMM|nr:MAG: hypothetical protein BECKLPF1236A_GA0070988_103165 [Candidatus Kentron sp. LPFa]VFK35017.1 MAG: hypothetical protein BECKLPF1236C_GA0070990_103225 [Candidatus Kentron sp. LPFa]
MELYGEIDLHSNNNVKVMNSLTRYDSMVFACQYEYIKGRKPSDGDIEYFF